MDHSHDTAILSGILLTAVYFRGGDCEITWRVFHHPVRTQLKNAAKR